MIKKTKPKKHIEKKKNNIIYITHDNTRNFCFTQNEIL
jgi:hypothetical protein